MSCRLVDEIGRQLCEDRDRGAENDLDGVEAGPGELQVTGETMFKEYINLPKETKDSFTEDGWFRTGDVAVRTSAGDYRILGRMSTDIIKSSGFKLSSLEIERVLLAHPWVAEVAVCGEKHDTAGEIVSAVVVLLKPVGGQLDAAHSTISEVSFWIDKYTENIEDMQNTFVSNIRQLYLSRYLADYKHPKRYYFADQLPRNQLGKVNKKTLLKEICR